MSPRKKAIEVGGTARRHRRWLLTAGGAIVVLVGGWALALMREPAVTRAKMVEYAPIAGPLVFPTSVTTASPELQALYQFAAQRPDVLHDLPCFCGCGWVHHSNYDCFIDEVRADGSVLIDSMSFT